MGGLPGMLGLGGGAAGTGFAGPQSADFTGINEQFNQQNALLDALKNQNGLGKQSNVYDQLQGIVSGTGPNPAKAMLNQATGANAASTAALMAGQRGSSQNVGLMARNAGMAGANLQQQAVGQGATMQANQSLNALTGAGNMANTMASNQINQTNANTMAHQQLINSQVQMQGNVNNANAGLANTQLQNQAGVVGGIMSLAGGMGGMAGGGMVGNYADGGMTPMVGPQSDFAQYMSSSMPEIAAPVFSGSNPGADALKKGIESFKPKTGGSGGSAGPTALPQGAGNPNQAIMGGQNLGASPAAAAPAQAGPVASGAGALPSMGMPLAGGGLLGSIMQMAPMLAMAAAHGGIVPAVVSPGEKVLDPSEAEAVADGKLDPSKAGKVVPGKPKYKGNNYANDTVKANLPEGGVVIPNSVMQSKDPAAGAAKFVQAVLAKKRMRMA